MRLINENLQRQLQVFDDENNIMTSPVTGIWPPTTLDAVFDQEHPNQRTLREIIADLRQEIITGGIGNIIFPVTSVNGQSVANGNADVVIRAATIGLGFVNNTADMNKPLSTPQRAAVNQMLSTFDWQTGNVTLARLYEHLEDKENPHHVTVDQLGNPDFFTNIMNNAITFHNMSTNNLTHPDMRRDIRLLFDQVTNVEDLLERRIAGVLNDIISHLSDPDAHLALFELKEDKANKTTYFNVNIDNNHVKYPTTRAVLDVLTNRLLEFKDEFKEHLLSDAEWIANIRVIDDITQLPDANEENHRQVFLIRNHLHDLPSNDLVDVFGGVGSIANRMGIAICRHNGTDYFWDVHNSGAISRLHKDHFIETEYGYALNLTAIIDAVAIGGDPSSVGSILNNFFTKQQSLDMFVRNITIVPGSSDGHIRYFLNDDSTTPIHVLDEDAGASNVNNTFNLSCTLEDEILPPSIGVRIQSRQVGVDAAEMFDFAITNIIVNSYTGANLFNLVTYLTENPNINEFSTEFPAGSGMFVSNFPMLGQAGTLVSVVRPGGGANPFLTVTNREAEWQGLDILNDFFNFAPEMTVYVSGRILHRAGSNTMILNGNTRYWREVAIPGLRNLAFKEWITENEIIDNAVHTRHLLNRAVTARTIGDREVQARGPHHPHVACEFGRIIGNILHEDVDEAHEVSLVQLADYLRPLIGGWPDPGVPGGNPWLTWVRDMILSPHHYTPGVEYDLRDQSYAMRFTGWISCIPNMNHEQILSEEICFPTRRLLDAGGVWQFSSNVNGGEWSILGGLNVTGHTFGTIIMDHNALRFVSLSTGDRMNSPYDFWVRYYKTDSPDIFPPPPPPEPPPPNAELILTPSILNITDTNLTGFTDVTGTGIPANAPIHVDRLNLPAEIEVFVSGNRITLVGNRPIIQHPDINQSFMVIVGRSNVHRVLSVNVNLTASLSPLAFHVIPQLVVVRDHQPVGTFIITGSNTAPVTIDRSAIPPSINVEVEVPTLGPDTPADMQNSNGVVIVTGNRPAYGQPSIRGIFPLRIMRDGMTKVVVVDVNLTSINLVTLVSQQTVHISNTNLTSTVIVGGTTIGDITANSDYTLPPNIVMTIDQVASTISLVADRPHPSGTPIEQEFAITINRQGRSAVFRIIANLTPWPTPGTITGMSVVPPADTVYGEGPYQVTLTGTNLEPSFVRIGLFLNNTGDDMYTIIPEGNSTQVVGTVNVPTGNSWPNMTNMVWTIRASANAGVNFPATPSHTVTVTPTTPPD